MIPTFFTFNVSREVKVEDVADVRNVYSSGRDIGGDEEVDFAGPEIFESLLTVALLAIAVNALARNPLQAEVGRLSKFKYFLKC